MSRFSKNLKENTGNIVETNGQGRKMTAQSKMQGSACQRTRALEKQDAGEGSLNVAAPPQKTYSPNSLQAPEGRQRAQKDAGMSRTTGVLQGACAALSRPMNFKIGANRLPSWDCHPAGYCRSTIRADQGVCCLCRRWTASVTNNSNFLRY